MNDLGWPKTMARKIARLVGQINDIRHLLLRRLDEANTFLAMLPPHRAWMFWGIERLNCGHPDLTRLDPSNMPR